MQPLTGLNPRVAGRVGVSNTPTIRPDVPVRDASWRQLPVRGDLAYVIAGLVFGITHLQTEFAVAAPAGLVLAVLIASTSSARKGGFSILAAGLVVAAIAAGGVGLAVVNGLTEDVTFLGYIRDRAPFVYVAAIVLGLSLLRPNFNSAASFCIGFSVIAAAMAAVVAGVALTGGEFLGEFRLIRRGRYQGLLSGPNSFAGAMAPAMLCTVAFWKMRLPGWALLRFPVFAFTSAGLLLTASRGYLLGTVLAGVVLAGLLSPKEWRSRTGRSVVAVLVVVALAGASYLAAAERISSLSDDRNVTSRVDFWQRGAALWNDSPFVGFGFGIFEQHDLVIDRSLPGFAGRADGSFRDELVQFEADGGQHAHNFFLQTGVDVGLIGLTIYLGVLALGSRGVKITQALFVLGAIAGIFGGYALASASGSAPLLILVLAGIGQRTR